MPKRPRDRDSDDDLTEAVTWKETPEFLATTDALGRNIRRCREHHKLTLEQASEKMGIDYRHLAKIETGDLNPTAFTLFRVARGLDVSLESLFRRNVRNEK